MVTDFREEMYITHLYRGTFSFAWVKIDKATDEKIDLDWGQECSYEELFNALELHGFDIDKVFNHFEDYPYSKIMLVDEY